MAPGAPLYAAMQEEERPKEGSLHSTGAVQPGGVVAFTCTAILLSGVCTFSQAGLSLLGRIFESSIWRRHMGTREESQRAYYCEGWHCACTCGSADSLHCGLRDPIRSLRRASSP